MALAYPNTKHDFISSILRSVRNKTGITAHTNYKWSKISVLENTNFGLEMMVKSGLEFFILNRTSPFRDAAVQFQKKSVRKAELAWLVSPPFNLHPEYNMKGSL